MRSLAGQAYERSLSLKALLVSGWVDQSFTFLRSLSRRPVELHVADCWPNSPTGRSRYCTGFHLIPPPDSEDHVREILAVCKRVGIDVVLPVQHDEVLILAARKAEFIAQGIALPIPPGPLMSNAIDKYWVSQIAEENALAGPKTVLLEQAMSSDLLGAGIEFPAVVKLRCGTGQARQKRIENADDLRKYASSEAPKYGADEVIVQEFIPGDDWDGMYSVGLLYDSQHRLKACVPLKKMRSRPYDGGTAVCTQAEARDDVAQLAIGLMESIGDWEGIADVEIKLDPRDGEPKLIELNPRAWGSIYGAYAAGVDLPWLWLQAAQGIEFPNIEGFRVGIPGSFFARDLCLFADLLEALFTRRRGKAARVLRTYLHPYVSRKHWRYRIPGTADLVLRDLRPLLTNLWRVRKDIVPGFRRLRSSRAREDVADS